MNNQDQTQRDRQARDIFLRAVEIKSPEGQALYIEGACQQDVSLRSRVEALLKSHKQDSFLETAAVEGASTLISETRVTEGPGAVIDRYKLLQKLGEGGFGVVYLAEQKEPVKRRVALKIIKLGMDTQQVVARFEAERQALAMMDHPNIAKVLDAGATETGRPYFVMELVKGVPITKYCDDNQLTTKERLDLFIAVCQAIQHAHQKGIIHRDIKPSNIMITLHDGVPVPKVIDFGIAKATQQELTEKTIFTQHGQFIGTPAYMSPEQAEMSGLDIDTRSDIYSLGVVLYELLVGRTPLDGKELMSGGYEEIRRRIKEEEPAKPSTKASTFEGAEKTTIARHRKISPGQLSNELRGDLDWIVLKALEKDRTRRYETANGFALDIKRYLSNEPVTAVAPSPSYLLKKYVRRHRAALAVAAAIAGLLIIGTTVSTWQAIRATRAGVAEKEQRLAALTERDKAQTAQKEAENAKEAEKLARLRADAEKAEARRLFYVANMNLAQQAWEQNNIGRLRELLEETRESLNRGFEWYYWQRQTHLSLKTLRGHWQPVSSVAFSPDGRWIVTGSEDQTAKVWDVASGTNLLTLNAHSAPIRSVAFSPDGQRIVTGSLDQTAIVWEAASGTKLITLKGHNAGINSVAFLPDGRRILTGSGDKTAKVWEAASGTNVLTLKGHSARINSVAFSPDGRRIVTGSEDQTAKVWEADSGRDLLTFKGHSAGINSVAFSPDSQRIVTGSKDQTVRVWEAASGRPLLTLPGHSGSIRSVAFSLSPDGERIVSGSEDQTAKLWEAASGTNLVTLKGHSAGINSVAFSPDGQRIVTASHDQTAKLWETASLRDALTLKGHSSFIRSVAFSPDGQRIVTASHDQTAKVWEAASGRELITLKGHGGAIFSAAFFPGGQRVVTGSEDTTAKVWDVASGRELLTFKGHRGVIFSVAISRDGQRVVTGSLDKTAKVWEVASGKELLTLKGHSGLIWSLAYSPDGQRIVTGSGDQTAKVWEATSGTDLLTLKGHTGIIWDVAFSPDSQRIVTASHDQTAKVWEAASGTYLFTLRGHSAPVGFVTFSPDGQRIVTGSEDHTAKMWEAASGRELLTLKGHTDEIMGGDFSPDGQRIVTASADKSARAWEAAGTEQVAAWQKEEHAVAQSLAALQGERTAEQERQRIARAREEGAIKRWLILATIPLPAGQSGTEGLDTEQIEGEARLRPKAGEGTIVAGGEMKWQEVAVEDYVIDFCTIVGRSTPRSVAYAVCYIRSEVEQSGLRMLVGSDDAVKVYLNGKQVHKYPFPHSFVPDQDRESDILLNAGLNVLVFKLVNELDEHHNCQWSIRFTDAQGNPVKGIKVTLDPVAKH